MLPPPDAYPELFLAIAQDRIREEQRASMRRSARRSWWRVVLRRPMSR